MSIENDYDVVSKFVDAGFGVVQFSFRNGNVVQYTRQVGDKVWSNYYRIGDNGEKMLNCTLTHDEFDKLLEDNSDPDDVVTAGEFEVLVRKHDLFYQYADDHRVWLAGLKAADEIDSMAKRLGGRTASSIYNRVVDERVSSQKDRAKFYRTFEVAK